MNSTRMQLNGIRTAAIFLLLAGLGACATGPRDAGPAAESQVTEIKAMKQVKDALSEKPLAKTLLVFDIDDTLLTSSTFFGSDYWYEWQKSLKPGDAGKALCLFDVIGVNYELGTQRATEADAVVLLNTLSNDTLLLTARNPMYRGGTERELLAAGYTLPAMLGAPQNGEFFDFPAVGGSPVSYQRGILMVSGKNKGELLLELLRRRNLDYQRVVLVDDGRRNIDNMQAALKTAGIDYRGLWYTRIDKPLEVPTALQRQGVEGWRQMQDLMQAVFPERLTRWQNGQCGY